MCLSGHPHDSVFPLWDVPQDLIDFLFLRNLFKPAETGLVDLLYQTDLKGKSHLVIGDVLVIHD